MVLATRGLENAFFKDVSNESTTFDAPKAAKQCPNRCKVGEKCFQIVYNCRINV